jgi:sugar phosphate isomerase/epimerase
MLCASELRFSWGKGGLELVRLAVDAGYAGLAVGPSCSQRDLAPLVAEAVGAGLRVPLLAAPLGDGILPPGRRLPYLAGLDDRDERLSALRLVEDTWAAASPLGASFFTLELGAVELHGDPRTIAYRFARRELDEDEPGERQWRAVLAQRRALSPMVIDACRESLDRLLPRAEAAGLELGLQVMGPWGVPTPREAEALLDEYRGGPLGLVWDEARIQALTAAGVGPSIERRQRLARATRVLRCSEAVGIETGFAPGLGDPDGTGTLDFGASGSSSASTSTSTSAPASNPPPEWTVVGGRSDTTLAEIIRARTEVASRLPASPSTRGSS